MDKKVIWTNEAVEDIESTAEYISRDSPFYASAFVEAVLETGKAVKDSPKNGARDLKTLWSKEQRDKKY